MNTGIQDAWNLGWKLALVVQGAANEQLLESYEAERWPVGRTLFRYIDRVFSTFTRAISTGRLASWARAAVAPRVLPRLLESSWGGGWSTDVDQRARNGGATMSHRLTLVLLPGLDGTGKLFSRFVEHLPEELEPKVVALPTERELGYPELVRHVRNQLPQDRPFALLGESFSGPVALQLAVEHPPGLLALVLVASFHRSPVAWWGRAVKPFARPLLSRPPPAWAARLFLTGRNAPAGLVTELRSAVAEVAPDVLAARVRSALDVDATGPLATCPVPLLYLGGSRDRILRRSIVHEMQRVQPSMQHRLLDAPHLVLQREPVASGAIISGFLRGLERRHDGDRQEGDRRTDG